MEPITITFVDAFVAALGSGALLLLYRLVRFFVGISSKLDQLIETDKDQTEAIYIFAKGQQPQFDAHLVTLDVLSGAECNGNVEAVREAIQKSSAEFNAFLVRKLERKVS